MVLPHSSPIMDIGYVTAAKLESAILQTCFRCELDATLEANYTTNNTYYLI